MQKEKEVQAAYDRKWDGFGSNHFHFFLLDGFGLNNFYFLKFQYYYAGLVFVVH